MGQPVVHFEIMSCHADELRAHYAQLFGWELDTGDPPGSRIIGPEQVTAEVEIGLFWDPEGHTVGVVKTPA